MVDQHGVAVESDGEEVLSDGRRIKYVETRRGKRRYLVESDADRETLRDLIKEEKRRKMQEARKKNPKAGARYQRKVRRRVVVKRHYPWLDDEQIARLVNACLNNDPEYKKNPSQYLQKMAVELGYVSCCPTCGRGVEASSNQSEEADE